jgi:hypothetical protein
MVPLLTCSLKTELRKACAGVDVPLGATGCHRVPVCHRVPPGPPGPELLPVEPLKTEFRKAWCHGSEDRVSEGFVPPCATGCHCRAQSNFFDSHRKHTGMPVCNDTKVEFDNLLRLRLILADDPITQMGTYHTTRHWTAPAAALTGSVAAAAVHLTGSRGAALAGVGVGVATVAARKGLHLWLSARWDRAVAEYQRRAACDVNKFAVHEAKMSSIPPWQYMVDRWQNPETIRKMLRSVQAKATTWRGHLNYLDLLRKTLPVRDFVENLNRLPGQVQTGETAARFLKLTAGADYGVVELGWPLNRLGVDRDSWWWGSNRQVMTPYAQDGRVQVTGCMPLIPIEIATALDTNGFDPTRLVLSMHLPTHVEIFPPVVAFRKEIDNFEAMLFVAGALNVSDNGPINTRANLLTTRKQLLAYRGAWVFQVELVKRPRR